MKFVFVVGGTYKGFYFNQLKKIKYLDLLVFNQGIFYELDDKDDLIKNIVYKELIELNTKLKCPILVCGVLNKNKIRQKIFILCINKKVSIIDYRKYIYLYIKNKLVLITGSLYKKSKAFATIAFINELNMCKKFCGIKDKNYFLCDKKSVTYIKNKKINKKFRKCCYFTLNSSKKML